MISRSQELKNVKKKHQQDPLVFGNSPIQTRTGKRGDFLGQVSLGWKHLHLNPGETSREIDLTLGLRDGVPARDQGFVQGTIKMLVERPAVEVHFVLAVDYHTGYNDASCLHRGRGG